MFNYWMGNACLVLSMLSTSGSQIAFKSLFNETGPMVLNWSFVQALFSPGRVFRLSLAVVLLVAGFLFWLLCLSRLNVSYAYPIACSSALLVTFFGAVFLSETVPLRVWWGTVLIVLGTILIAPPAEQTAAPAGNASVESAGQP